MSTGKRSKLARSISWTALVGLSILAEASPLVALQSQEKAPNREWVTSALLAEGPALADVRAEIKDDVVELVGFVDTLAASDAAEEAVSSTPSVRAVVNRIEVRRTNRPASQIEHDYREILRAEPATESFEFDIDGIDENGILTLSGEADSGAEKQLAQMAARRVRGVRGIVNDIEVRESEKSRPDAEIEQEIRTLFEWDTRVDASLLAVSVRDGVARLTGVAASPRQKIQAILLSYVAGVKRVDATQLPVVLNASPTAEVRAAPTDEEIRSALEHALTVDPRVPEESIKVRVADGVARLEGRVGRLVAKRIAEEDARNVFGVIGVSDAIDVVPTDNLTSEQIEKNVKTLLGYDPLVGNEDLEVSVDRGVVTVTGTVASARERDRVIEAASRARGVLEVRPEITIAKESFS